MSDKWQLINLKLDAGLAQALRDMKRGHDESLSEVVIRLLEKVVRQSTAGARGAPDGRVNPKAATRRGGFGTGRKGKPMAPAGRAAPGVAGKGKPFVPREAPRAEAWAATRGKPRPAGTLAPPHAPRRRTGKAGKVFRPQQFDGASEAGPRNFRARAGAGGPRSFPPRDDLGTAEGRPKRQRKARASRPSKN
jgi:hypothetical protein